METISGRCLGQARGLSRSASTYSISQAVTHQHHSARSLLDTEALHMSSTLKIFFRNSVCVLWEVSLSDSTTALVPCSSNNPLLLYSSFLLDENRSLCNIDSAFVEALPWPSCIPCVFHTFVPRYGRASKFEGAYNGQLCTFHLCSNSKFREIRSTSNSIWR